MNSCPIRKSSIAKCANSSSTRRRSEAIAQPRSVASHAFKLAGYSDDVDHRAVAEHGQREWLTDGIGEEQPLQALCRGYRRPAGGQHDIPGLEPGLIGRTARNHVYNPQALTLTGPSRKGGWQRRRGIHQP